MLSPPSRIAAVILVSLFSIAAQADPLQVALEPGSADGTVRVSLTNTGASTLSVLRWDTPFEDTLSSDVFRVERPRKGWPLTERAAYVGREVKRAEPAADQYLVLEPGRTISRSVALNDYYKIDKADRRQVRFAGQIRYAELVMTSQNNSVRKIPSPAALSITAIESNSVQISVSPELSVRVLAPAYNNCSVQQQADIIAAAQLAQNYVAEGIADLQSLAANERSASPRFTTWFGVYSDERFRRVASNYQAIGAALENEQIRFDCGCDENGVYAYVYPNRPYDIFLCPAFRASNVSGTDSRAGTLVHELSHFTILADTDDHVYSQRGAQSLASTDPAKAVTNADNHEYFAENWPALTIRGATSTPGSLQHQVLALDVPVSGRVGLNDSLSYQVSGASQITLSSLVGDADLYLYSDAALTAESCQASSESALDVCENFAEGAVYVRVFGNTAASFTLVATAGATTRVAPSTVNSLPLDNGVAGALEADERLVYQISGAELIELESLTGDADLYVFNALEFLDTTLICVSNAYSSESTTESCILPSPADTYYLLVVGFTASDYSLMAFASGNEPSNGPESVNRGRLVVGETASESVAAGQFHYFVVAGASSVQLTSSTGDADLSVYTTPDHADTGQVCVSTRYTAESVVDACDIPSGADHYIAIFGYEATSYTLLAASTPAEDDPTPGVPPTPQTGDNSQTPVVSSGGGGGGGGSLNFWGIGLLVLTVACRRSVCGKC